MYATVCIATHRRNVGLERLLDSLTSQQGASPFDVVVVDNDQEKSAQMVAFRFRDKIPLTYLVEPVRGIARTRNRAVAVSRSPFLAFIDDDEWASPQWLAALERRQNRSAADVVIGRVEVEFDAEVSELVRRCGLFDSSQLPDGAILPWYCTRTSNAFVRREALPDQEAPFSTRFDLSGGEDVHLFKRMIESGALVVASAAAVVFEHRPIARANLIWIFRRAMRNGGILAELNRNEISATMRARRALQVGWAGASELLRAGAVWRRNRAKAGRHIVSGGNEIGKLLHILGIRIEEYRHHQ
jgi:succinoglycan biosynthesis protein ExoM